MRNMAKSLKKGDIGYIKSYRGTYAVRLQDGSFKEIFQDKDWDQDVSVRGFTSRVEQIKTFLYKREKNNEKGK